MDRLDKIWDELPVWLIFVLYGAGFVAILVWYDVKHSGTPNRQECYIAGFVEGSYSTARAYTGKPTSASQKTREISAKCAKGED